MNLPNLLTLSRIFAVPLLVVVLLTRVYNPERQVESLSVILATVIFLGASITDYFDGYLARRRRQVTTLGMLLDPMADKLLISAAFISLVELGWAPAWMVVIIVGRELAITGLRSIAARQGLTIDARSWENQDGLAGAGRHPDHSEQPRLLVEAAQPGRALADGHLRIGLGRRLFQKILEGGRHPRSGEPR